MPEGIFRKIRLGYQRRLIFSKLAFCYYPCYFIRKLFIYNQEVPSGIAYPLAMSPRQGELDHYLGTRDMVLWQKSICHTHGIKRIVLVSYLPHFLRGQLATEKVGLEVLIPEGIIEIYDSKNSQRWATSGLVNRPYELLARLYYFFKDWI